MDRASCAVATEEAAAELLYGHDPADFVAARDQLVRSLRKAGNRPLATTVKTWRRPTALAGELNRLLRSDDVAVETLISAAEALRAGQERALCGEHVDVAALRSTHRKAAADLAAAAVRDGDRVRDVLERTSLDPAHHNRLRAASYAVEPTPSSGFDLLDSGLHLRLVTSDRQPGLPLAGEVDRAGRAPSDDRTGSDPFATAPGPKARVEPDPGGAETVDPPQGQGTQSTPDPAAETSERGDQVDPDPGPDPDRLAGAADGLERAERRLSSAIVARDTAARRVAELEERLAEANRNLADRERRLATAEESATVARTTLSELTERSARIGHAGHRAADRSEVGPDRLRSPNP